MKKLEIQEPLKEEIIEKNKNGSSIRKLMEEYGYSFTVIQKLINERNFQQKIEKNYPTKPNMDIVAICKKTNQKFIDYMNNSGAITKYILNLYPEEAKTTKYLRKSVEYKTGRFWYDQYFIFEYEEKKEIKKCYFCDWSTNDVNNKSGAYQKHLKSQHNLDVIEYLKINPDDSDYFKNIPPTNGVTCQICGENLRIITNTHLKKHNLTVLEYKLKYSENTVSHESHLKLSKSTIETNKNQTISKTSKAENEIKEFLKSHGIKLLQSTRKYLQGIEIDLYSKEHSIGIEYNGNVYHSELFGGKGKNYHLNKTKIAAKNGINLYQIHEDEWYFNQDLVKAKLLHIFNINNGERIFARKCSIREITSKEKSEFLNNNHMQGNDNSSICLGAYYNNLLCAVMTFSRTRTMNRYKKNNNFYDLTRFAVLNGYVVVGIASKLLKTFIRKYNPNKIISFADRRWTPDKNKNLYTALGFKCTAILPPDYSYYKKSEHRGKRLHKFGFGKSNLKKRFPNSYSKDKTEWEIMQSLGYDRIWDCGKFRYELDFKN